jgi:hypothetical protein
MKFSPDRGREKKRANAPKGEVRFAPDRVEKLANHDGPKISQM